MQDVQQEEPQRPQPITGEELEERIKLRRARAAAQRAKRKRERGPRRPLSRNAWIGLSLCAVIGVSAAASAATTALNQSQLHQVQSQIVERAQQADDDTANLSRAQAVDVATLTEQARTEAQKVAAAQQGMNAAIAVMMRASDEQDGVVPQEQSEQLEKQMKAAGKLFTDAAKPLPADQVSATATGEMLGMDQVDPRLPWFTAWRQGQPLSAEDYRWEVGSVQPQLDRNGQFAAEVIFVCKDKEDRLLAWAHSQWRQEGFTSLTAQTTQAGAVLEQAVDGKPAADAGDQDKGPAEKEGADG